MILREYLIIFLSLEDMWFFWWMLLILLLISIDLFVYEINRTMTKDFIKKEKGKKKSKFVTFFYVENNFTITKSKPEPVFIYLLLFFFWKAN